MTSASGGLAGAAAGGSKKDDHAALTFSVRQPYGDEVLTVRAENAAELEEWQRALLTARRRAN